MADFEVRTDSLNVTAETMSRVSTQISNISNEANRVLTATRHSITMKIGYALQKSVICENLNFCARDFGNISKGLKKVSSYYQKYENNNLQRDQSWKSADKLNGVARDIADSVDEDMSYDEWLEYRYNNASDPKTKALYEKYIKKISINKDDYNDTAHYNPILNHINYNEAKDLENERGPGTTYYHEVGHLIDDKSDWWGSTSEDGSYKFYNKLSKDMDNYISKVMKEEGCSKEDAYAHISNWLWSDADAKNGVSDLVNGLTEGKACGRWLHEDSYYNKSSICNEAFAHFFEAGMSANPEKLEYIKEVFPSAYKEYQKMIEDELN